MSDQHDAAVHVGSLDTVQLLSSEDLVPLRILLIDDDAFQYKVLAHLLAQLPGYQVTLDWVTTYAEGLAMLQQRCHDLYLVDYHLGPEQPTGIDLLRAGMISGAQLPIIMLTGVDDRNVDIAAMQAGATDYLTKGPLLAQLLERSIRYALSEARMVTALRASEERYALALQASSDGLWDWDIRTDELYVSPRWLAMLGESTESFVPRGASWIERVHAADRPHLLGAITAQHLGQRTPFELEYRLQHQNGAYCWVWCRGLAVRDRNGVVVRMVGSHTDICTRKQLEAQLLHDAFHDGLTGLPNRALFFDRLERAITYTSRHPETPFAVLFLDLDGFKLINDSLGHLVGDEILIMVAQRLCTCVRASDTVARLGGDEFVILLNGFHEVESPARVAERVQHALGEPLMLQGHSLVVTASIGIALSNTGYTRPEDVLRDADTAMYRAKALGRACHEFFDVAMHASAVSRLRIEMELRQAIEQQEFVVYYQPIVELAGRQIIGVEALIRWRHPRHGLIPPLEFLPIAEETGLIIPIGRWMIGQACRDVQQWLQEGAAHPDLSVSINLSNKQFWHPGLISFLKETLLLTQLSARSLRLEITEGVILDHMAAAAQILRQLQELAIHLHIDDFGTGYSSLKMLSTLPIEAFKIDQSFIADLDLKVRNQEIVRTILRLGQQLGITVIIEGIETEAQASLLLSLGCLYGQGYLFGRPSAAGDITILMRENRVTAPLSQ